MIKFTFNSNDITKWNNTSYDVYDQRLNYKRMVL